MKIMCQEHYDKVVQYAESIGDNMLRECLERLERRDRNPCCPCQIELYRDFAPYSYLFKKRYPDGRLGLVDPGRSNKSGRDFVLLLNIGNFA